MIFHQTQNSLSNYNFNAFHYSEQCFDYHFHRNLELIYVIKGKVNCIVNNCNYTLTVGDFGLCLPFNPHSLIPEKDSNYWILVFSEDYIRFLSKQLQGKNGSKFQFRCNEVIESFIREQLINNPEPTTLTLKSCLYAVLEEYLNQVELIDKSAKEYRIISLISDYVEKNHTQRLTLSDLAKKLGYDYNYMSRYFHSTFNMSFSNFVNVYRVATAAKLLEETYESITAIAFKSGFQSVRSFNDIFKKSTNLSPSEYRKASRK